MVHPSPYFLLIVAPASRLAALHASESVARFCDPGSVRCLSTLSGVALRRANELLRTLLLFQGLKSCPVYRSQPCREALRRLSFEAPVDELHQPVIRNIRELAEERQLPVSHLPDRAAVARSHFWEVLAGRTSPTLMWLGKVAAALEVDPEELVARCSKECATRQQCLGLNGAQFLSQGQNYSKCPVNCSWPLRA